MSGFDYRYELGRRHGRAYRVGVRVDPSPHSVDSFAVVLFFTRSDGRRVSVAKIDDSEHDAGTVHVDRYYRETGAPVKDFDVDIATWDEAEAYLTDHWRQFADRYARNHGTRGEE